LSAPGGDVPNDHLRLTRAVHQQMIEDSNVVGSAVPEDVCAFVSDDRLDILAVQLRMDVSSAAVESMHYVVEGPGAQVLPVVDRDVQCEVLVEVARRHECAG